MTKTGTQQMVRSRAHGSLHSCYCWREEPPLLQGAGEVPPPDPGGGYLSSDPAPSQSWLKPDPTDLLRRERGRNKRGIEGNKGQLGWVIGLALIGLILFLLAGPAPERGGKDTPVPSASSPARLSAPGSDWGGQGAESDWSSGEDGFLGAAGAGASAAAGPCHPLANGEANPADTDPACQPSDPEHCPHPLPSDHPSAPACLPVYQTALHRSPTDGCHPLPDGEANPYDTDPACLPIDPQRCHRVQVGPPNPDCLPAYKVALAQPPSPPGTDCHPLANGQANPADPDPACRPADPKHCHRLPMTEHGPFAPACGFANQLLAQQEQARSATNSATNPATSSSPTPANSPLSPPPVSTGNFFFDGFWAGVEQLVADVWSQLLDWLGSFTFMFETPKSLTYGHFVVVAGYRLSLGMVSGLLTLALVLEGYRLLRASVGGGGAWLSTSTVLWDLLLALAGGLSFPLLCQLIELSNQCAREFLFAFGSSSAGALGFTDLFSALRTITAPLAWIIFAVVALVVLLLLSLVRLVQIALLDVLLILLPVWALAWATPGLRPYGRLAATLLGELLLVQVLQDISLGMGAALIAGLGHATATPLSLLVGLAACYLAFRMPALLSRSVQAAQGSLPAVGEQLAVLLSLWL